MAPIRAETCNTCQAYNEAENTCLDMSPQVELVIIELAKGEVFTPKPTDEIVNVIDHKGGARTLYVKMTFWPKTTSNNPACGRYRLK